MLATLVLAGLVLDEPRYLESARRAEQLLGHSFDGEHGFYPPTPPMGAVHHTYQGGQRRGHDLGQRRGCSPGWSG